MSKRIAKALHLVEKGIHPQNLYRVPETDNEWFTGNWRIGDKSATQLIGKNIYLHPGQLEKSHLGGEILSFAQSKTKPERKVFRFRKLDDCIGIITAKEGWSNEKKIDWL